MQSLTLLLAAFAPAVLSKVIEVTDSLPDGAVPFVVRHLEGPKVLLADDVFRTLADTKNTINGSANTVAAGFSMLLTNGKPNDAVPPHYVSISLHMHLHFADHSHSTSTGMRPSYQ